MDNLTTEMINELDEIYDEIVSSMRKVNRICRHIKFTDEYEKLAEVVGSLMTAKGVIANMIYIDEE